MAKQSLIYTEMKLKQAKHASYQHKPFMQAFKTTRRGNDPLLFRTPKPPPLKILWISVVERSCKVKNKGQKR